MDSAAAVSADFSCPPPHSPSSPPPPAPVVVVNPCAACKMLRRRCTEKCLLAPYFPPPDRAKFAVAHRVFGASNIIKFLQELPESQRADAATSLVYEARARIRDPVYGCAGAICHLQKQVNELQAQLAKAEAEVLVLQWQQNNLMALLSVDMAQSPQQCSSDQQSVDNLVAQPQTHCPSFVDEPNLWEPFWT